MFYYINVIFYFILYYITRESMKRKVILMKHLDLIEKLYKESDGLNIMMY